MALRIQFILYFIRDNIINIKISKYIWIRIIIYMYLTIFYYYLFEELYIINKYLFYILIICELLIIYKMEEIIKYFEKDLLKIEELLQNNVYETYVTYLYTFKNPLYWRAFHKWDWSLSIWDITLSNSVSLNILYKYILFVNKNTKGYFDKQMNIGARPNEIRIMATRGNTIEEIDVIIWSILPRTRYVIINLKYRAYETTYDIIYIKQYLIAQYKINLSHNKNLYLSYYEKTYGKVSLLMLVWIMRTNLLYWECYWWEIKILYSKIMKDENINDFIYTKYSNTVKMLVCLYLYIMRYDKRLIKDVNMLLNFFFKKEYEYFLEEKYFELYEKNLIKEGSILPISNKICGLKQYKKIFKIMSRIMWMEEETVNWNSQLFEMHKNFKNLIIKIYVLKNVKSKKEQKFFELYDIMQRRLRGEGIVFPMGHDIMYFKECEIDILSRYCKLKNKEEYWIYNNFDKLWNNGWKLEEILEMDDKNTILDAFIIIDEYNILFMYIYVLNYHIFFEEYLNSDIEIQDFWMLKLEKYFEYKDYQYFTKIKIFLKK